MCAERKGRGVQSSAVWRAVAFEARQFSSFRSQFHSTSQSSLHHC
jgi:hypothetical protein